MKALQEFILMVDFILHPHPLSSSGRTAEEEQATWWASPVLTPQLPPLFFKLILQKIKCETPRKFSEHLNHFSAAITILLYYCIIVLLSYHINTPSQLRASRVVNMKLFIRNLQKFSINQLSFSFKTCSYVLTYLHNFYCSDLNRKSEGRGGAQA